MSDEKLLTIREVAFILGISEKEVIELAESGLLPAYKVGGVYLRFKREQVEEFKKTFKHKNAPDAGYPLKEQLSDFFYFNDFYIYSAIIILLILIIIVRGY
ncbi:MAG: helix-turn-helix domain-containing protein [Candidatus Omnitrophica bacterium]|nr:helix-turn-helix domain-containing protein [Candidatus Omnitrophota bacterium]